MDGKDYSPDELNQVVSYFEMRNYADPHHSIPEIKGVYHPLYTPYDDSMFQIIDGLVAVPQGVLSDIIQRCENGELEVDLAQLEGFKRLLGKMD
ncbi:hypothetical protein ACFFH2_08425 [Enterococcus devriesei]|uniref:Uncharacterized protein n=1 Tax=Enterococcus devriesei TaxID=319970 RepID=A0A1L8SVZ4_9ENTE|nr:hypothetical protein [Enterococcus devriesei]OJG36126.1 hypothetical protein RV00_GL002270 [Enterococcus devriesei]